MNATKKFSCIQHDSSEQMYELMQTALGVKEWKAVDFQCAEYECAHLCTTMWYSVCAEKLFLFFCSSNSCLHGSKSTHQ